MEEYRVYYKDKENKTWDEWYEPAGFSVEEAEVVKTRIDQMSNTYDVEIRRMNEYYGENDGYGIVGYSFKCNKCGKDNRFVNEEDEEQECEFCGSTNYMITIQ